MFLLNRLKCAYLTFRKHDFVHTWTASLCIWKWKWKPLSHVSLQPHGLYWSGFLFPSPGDLPNPGTEPRSPALQVDSLLSEPKEALCTWCSLFLECILHRYLKDSLLTSFRSLSNVILSEKPYITPLYKIVMHLFELPFILCSVFFHYIFTFKEIWVTEVINENDCLAGWDWCVQSELIQISNHKLIWLLMS